ncbi:presqualene diphosphate synthase HpnD [Phenylobacterium sp.]|jgi:phytoene synthase|uniref:presqualene diphosphate synthase HpnD n=1 Tax=Phenylobacterium sp. TaxID=1871053 RepID=UPI002F3F2206
MTLIATASAPTRDAANVKAASSSSFSAGMKVLPRPQRTAMYAVYGFCRIVDDIADEPGPPMAAREAALDAWRGHVRALYAGGDPGPAAMLAHAVANYGLAEVDFQAVIDGMGMDLAGLRGPDLATLDLYCDRVASAVGRLSVRIFGMDETPGRALAHSLGRALQLTNILRDIDEDADMGRLYLPAELLTKAGILTRDPAEAVRDPRLGSVCEALAECADAHYRAAEAVLAGKPRGRLAPPRLMAAAYGGVLEGLRRRGWATPRAKVKVNKTRLLWQVARETLFG